MKLGFSLLKNPFDVVALILGLLVVVDHQLGLVDRRCCHLLVAAEAMPDSVGGSR